VDGVCDCVVAYVAAASTHASTAHRGRQSKCQTDRPPLTKDPCRAACLTTPLQALPSDGEVWVCGAYVGSCCCAALCSCTQTGGQHGAGPLHLHQPTRAPPHKPQCTQDIMLRGTERGVGTCTDVALYVMHTGARIVPLQQPGGAYDAACGARTARMLLETMYSEFISGGAGPGVLHLQLVNSEHMWEADAVHHGRVGVFLCKTRFCAALLKAHVAAIKWSAEVRLMGHSSIDPTVDLPPGVRRDKVGNMDLVGGLALTAQTFALTAP